MVHFSQYNSSTNTKTSENYPKVDFHTSSSLSTNVKYYSNCDKSNKVINEFIDLYLTEKSHVLRTERNFSCFIDYGVFWGKMKENELDLFKKHSYTLESSCQYSALISTHRFDSDHLFLKLYEK